MSAENLRNHSTHNCGTIRHLCVSGMEGKGRDKEGNRNGAGMLRIPCSICRPSPNRLVSDARGCRRLALMC
jgi:hypothetical protein